MTREPLKSALSLGDIAETSLALPSDASHRTGQRRVVEQVNTMKRTRSKYSRGSTGTLSPTSPKSDIVFYDYNPSIYQNGSDPFFEGTLANGQAKTRKNIHGMMRRSVSTRSSNYYRPPSNSMFLGGAPTLSLPTTRADYHARQMVTRNQTISSNQKFRQDMDLNQSPVSITRHTMPRNIQNTSCQFIGVNRHPPFTHHNPEAKISGTTKTEMNGMIGQANVSENKLSEAISCLTHSDERFQLHGASFIQHITFKDEKAKDEVRMLNGINPLVSLLNHKNPQIQQMSASALRNLVYKNSANKVEVRRSGGITEALQLLKDTKSAEIQKHVTGLLWNMSSEESIQPDLLRHALPVLTGTVLQPNADNTEISADAESRAENFCNATACLRNLSSGKLANRQALRNCEGLIDSLIKHVQSSVDSGSLNDKSVENCVCVLHNLTYQLEEEVPTMFTKISMLETRNNTADTGPIGCFSNQSHKIQKESDPQFSLDENNPKGKSWLTHSKTLGMYLHLLGNSENPTIKEACCSAMHNLTAKKTTVSDVLSQTIVQRLNGLNSLTPNLDSPTENLPLRNKIIALLGNFSRTPQLQRTLARKALPGVMKTLSSKVTSESESAMAVACHTANNLLRAQPDLGPQVINKTLISSLMNMSQNKGLPKASAAAGALLYSFWSDKTIQNLLKKFGMNKTDFVNDATSAAFRTLQIID